MSISITSVLKPLIDFTFPPVCCHCSQACSNPTQLCRNCLADIESVDDAELQLEMTPLLHDGPVDSIASLWMFDKSGPLSSVHRLLKYGNRPFLGVELGKLLADPGRSVGIGPDDLIIPVPLHRVRLLERGYNQSERLASGLCHALKLPAPQQLVTRARSTTTQTGLNKEQRVENLDNAFMLDPKFDRLSEHCVIVDDVLTTGATVASLARTLKSAGVRGVSVVTLGFTRPF